MEQSRRSGLDVEFIRPDEPNISRNRRQSGGFVDLGNESHYGRGGHQASGANEIFADVQGDAPWWKSNFFVSQPVLFGTWDGVFTSCLINIFGVIVFLRSGWIVGQAGLINAVFIVIFTVFVALITVLSAVGICERCRIESGGVYFIIAHTLGSRLGGSLGMIYCFGQAVGCALNVFGFGESMASLVSADNTWAARGFAIAAVLLLGTINVAGVKWVIKLQFVLLLVLLLAAGDFFIGSFTSVPSAEFKGWMGGTIGNNTWSDYKDDYTWFKCFGVFFPTITGILAGINMSGDLKNPSLNIPNGSLAAITTGTFLYLMFVITLAATVTRDALLTNFSITTDISAVAVLLLAGLYVSSMSSCLGAMYGTPRVLQSIANEKVIPGLDILGHGRGPNRVPIYSMVVVAVVTITFIVIGDINKLAPIVTMPFLITYASIDYSYFALAQTFDLQHRREMRFQGHSPPDPQVYGATGSDLDLLFPERIRHKTVNDYTPTTPSEASSPNGRLPNGDAHRPSVSVHSKHKNWYSHLCNRWLSLSGVAIKLVLMFLVHWGYALGCLLIIWLMWLYIGAANPAVKPGRASEFHFLHWMKICFLQAIGKRPLEYEQLVVTPVHADVRVDSERLNEENHDFASRRPYHQSTALQGFTQDHDRIL